jgi:hypothetical protein
MPTPHKIRFKCSVEDCPDFSKYGEFCGKHYKRWWRHGDPTVTFLNENTGSCAACSRPSIKIGLCGMHYRRVQRYGRIDLIRAPNGSGSQTGGYKTTYDDKGRLRYEHIIIAEKALGKPLPPGAVVHHVTQDRMDNHGPFKLVVCPDQAYHMKIHQLMREKGISFKTGWPND